MHRALSALAAALVATSSVLPAATLAASSLPHLHRPSSTANDASYSAARWAMVKPSVYIYTRTTIPHNSVSGEQVAQYALRFLGYPYTLTGNLPSLGFSCIGFVSYVYQSLGIPLPDDLWNGRAYAPAVPFDELRPGDILWFGNTVWPGLSHTGIYLGGGRFIHAAWFGIGVITSTFVNDPRYGNYWTQHYLGATRPWGGPGSDTASIASLITHTLFPTHLEQIPEAPAVLVTAPAQHLRRWWALDAPVITTVPQATPLMPLQRQGNWYQVMTPNGVTGWVASATPVHALALSLPARVAPRHVPAKRASRSARRRAASKRRGAVRRTAAAHRPTRSINRRVAARPVKARLKQATARRAAAAGSRPPGGAHPVHAASAPSRQKPAAPLGAATHSTFTPSTRARARHAAAATATALAASMQSTRTRVTVFTAPSTSATVAGHAGAGVSYWLYGTRGSWAHVTLTDGTSGWLDLNAPAAPTQHAPRHTKRARTVARAHHPSSGTRRTGARHATSARLTVRVKHAIRKRTQATRRPPVRRSSKAAQVSVRAGRRAHLRVTVRLHPRPSITSGAIRLIRTGTSVRVLAVRGSWVHIRIPRAQQGWVYGPFLR